MRRHRLQARSPVGRDLDVHVEELLVDSQFGDPRLTAAAIRVALGDYFARTGITQELAAGKATTSIDLGTLDGARRAQDDRNR